MYSTTSKPRRIRGTPKPKRSTFRTWYAYNSSARGARALKTASGSVNAVEPVNTRSGRIPWVTYTYLSEPRTSVKQLIAIGHNVKSFDLHFILRRAVQLKWRPELVVSGQKIILMKMEQIKFIDSISFLPFPLRKLSTAFGLTAAKGWYHHYFNSEENLDHVGSNPDTSYYDIDEMSAGERKEILEWYESQRSVLFDNRHVLETYCQDHVTVLRQACRMFRREFLEVGSMDVFHDSVTRPHAIKYCANSF